MNNTIPQIIKIDTREEVHDRMSCQLEQLSIVSDGAAAFPQPHIEESPGVSYRIASTDEKTKIFLDDFLEANQNDPVFKVRTFVSFPIHKAYS